MFPGAPVVLKESMVSMMSSQMVALTTSLLRPAMRENKYLTMFDSPMMGMWWEGWRRRIGRWGAVWVNVVMMMWWSPVQSEILLIKIQLKLETNRL